MTNAGLPPVATLTEPCADRTRAVRPDVQGRGIGVRLLDLAEDHARSLHLGEVRLYTNAAMTENLSYYPRHGYVETHRAECDGFRRVYFRNPLD